MRQSAEDRRQEIVRAAIALVAEHGSRGTTIAAVAEQVGITDAGVLYHFKTKDALLLAVIQATDRRAARVSAEKGRRGIDFLRAARSWGVGMQAYPEFQSLMVKLTAESVHEEGPTQRYLQARYRSLLGRFTNAFRVAAAAGDLRQDLDAEAEAAALLAQLDGARIQWLLLPDAVPLEDAVRTYVDGVLERLAPPEP